MCRLLGVSAREPAPLQRYLSGFPHGLLAMSLHGAQAPHRDGVGWAYRDGCGRMRLHRWGRGPLVGSEGLPGDLSRQTTLLVAHARKASPEYRTTLGALQAQPLVRDGLFLAHNGTIRDVAVLGEGIGTDSQRLLDWLVEAWRPRTPERLPAVLSKLGGMIRDYTAVNVVLTDGDILYALRLCARDPAYYTLHWRTGGGAVVVASEPLDEGPGWTALGNGELLAIYPDLSVAAWPAVPSPI